tara:strand:+ start:158 stop:1102 length:945 start_codon:yes stop_codon:yes gene_type:complete
MKISKTLVTSFVAIFVPTILIGNELLGQGIDVIYAYKTIPNTIWRPSEAFGFIMATLTVNNFYLGVYACSFLLTASLVFFFKKSIYRQYSIYLFYIIGISFSWPLLLASNNALRQGVSISLIIFSIGILKNIKNGFKRNILFLLTLIPLAFSHRYGQLAIVCIFSSYFLPKKFNSYLTILLISILTSGTLFVFFSQDAISYTAGPGGLKVQYFLIFILIIYNFIYCYFFKVIDFHERIALTITYTFTLFATLCSQNSVLSERLLHFPVVYLFLTLPSFAKVVKPKWFFSYLSIFTVFIYMCLSLYYVGFKYYVN